MEIDQSLDEIIGESRRGRGGARGGRARGGTVRGGRGGTVRGARGGSARGAAPYTRPATTRVPKTEDAAADAPPRRSGRSAVLDTSDGRMLKVGPASDSKKVAGMIAHVTREQGGPPIILAGGAASINQAVKAIAIAKQYLAEEESGPIDILVQPQFDGQSPRATLFLKASAPIPEDDSAEVLTVRSLSDPGKVAGAICGRIRENKAVALETVGPDGVYHVVEAVALSRRFLAEEQYDVKFTAKFQEMEWNDKTSSGLYFQVLATKVGV